jgi:hypothetical protein
MLSRVTKSAIDMVNPLRRPFTGEQKRYKCTVKGFSFNEKLVASLSALFDLRSLYSERATFREGLTGAHRAGLIEREVRRYLR